MSAVYYEIMNDWDIAEYTFKERKSAFREYVSAKAELDKMAWNMTGTDLPHDCESFETETDIYYIEKVETDD